MNIKVFQFFSRILVPSLFQFATEKKSFFKKFVVGLCQKRTERGYIEQKADSKQQRCDCLALSVSPSGWDLYKSVATSYANDSKVYLHTEQWEPVLFH